MAIASGPRSNTLYIGLSSDTKPVGLSVEFSAQFYEYDTAKTYLWTGSSRQAPDQGQWIEYLPMLPVFIDPTTAMTPQI